MRRVSMDYKAIIKKVCRGLIHGKSIFNPIEGKRWLVESKDHYRVDKRIVIAYLAILVGVFLYTAYQNNFDFSQHYYFNCQVGPCENHFYGKCSMDWCSEKVLPSGFVYGEPPPYMSENFGVIALLLGIVVIISNHFVHNRNYEMKED